MKGGIFLIQDNGALVEMSEQKYDSEDLLQALLEKYPNLLAGDQIDSESPRRWLLISREFGVPAEEDGGVRWSLDHLFLDQDAIPTLVEVKRSSDTRIRREVVGQMLDYAANGVVYWPVETIIAKFEGRCEKSGLDAEQELIESLGVESEYDTFWQNVKTNLQAGKVRLVFVADEIPAELRRIVEFLNNQMDPAEVLAVEISQYVAEGLKTLVPRVFGQTEEARKRKSGGVRETRQWDETSFLSDLKSRGLDKIKINGIERLLEEAKALKRKSIIELTWGKGKETGSYTIKRGGNSLISVSSNTHIWVNMGGWKTLTIEQKRELAADLGGKLGFDLKYADRSYPNISERIFSVENGISKLIQWLKSTIDKM
jgi:hypothetical protein